MLDSGCSHHICGRREWFSSYKKCEGKIVTLPNGKTVKVAGIGEVTMKRHNGRVQKLTQVRYIPELNRNLISLGKLVDLGYTVMMKNSMLKVTKGDLENKVVSIEGGGLYKFLASKTFIVSPL